jgi:hypothetical protein
MQTAIFPKADKAGSAGQNWIRTGMASTEKDDESGGGQGKSVFP